MIDPTIVVALISAGALVANTWVNRRHGKQLDEVHEQVKNTHSTNLREDLDRVLRAVSGLHRQVGGIRRELRDERNARTSLQEQVDVELRRRRNRVRQ